MLKIKSSILKIACIIILLLIVIPILANLSSYYKKNNSASLLETISKIPLDKVIAFDSTLSKYNGSKQVPYESISKNSKKYTIVMELLKELKNSKFINRSQDSKRNYINLSIVIETEKVTNQLSFDINLKEHIMYIPAKENYFILNSKCVAMLENIIS